MFVDAADGLIGIICARKAKWNRRDQTSRRNLAACQQEIRVSKDNIKMCAFVYYRSQLCRFVYYPSWLSLYAVCYASEDIQNLCVYVCVYRNGIIVVIIYSWISKKYLTYAI